MHVLRCDTFINEYYLLTYYQLPDYQLSLPVSQSPSLPVSQLPAPSSQLPAPSYMYAYQLHVDLPATSYSYQLPLPPATSYQLPATTCTTLLLLFQHGVF